MWQTLKRVEILDRSPWFKVFREEVLLEDGETIIPDFYIVDGPDWASTFALTPENEVVMLRSYLHGVGRETLSFPGGLPTSPDEDMLACAQRELLEETGYSASVWTGLGSFVLDGNRLYSRGHIYLATDAVQSAEPDSGDLEVQRVECIPLAELRTMWLAGQLATVAATLMAGLAFNALSTKGG
ncbi:MAG: NUDIX hydrolase [Chloroflexi bacterium]|nr:NUDIX hydrolase [Chloroflexota bacterium]